MKLKLLVLCLFAFVGFGASYALANNGHGKGHDQTTSSVSSTQSSTSATTTAPSKTLICHKTHSKKHPWVLISVSKHAVAAHLRHGDVLPTDGKCPTRA
jgi:hypothetical protein